MIKFLSTTLAPDETELALETPDEPPTGEQANEIKTPILLDIFSGSIVEMLNMVRPSVVQVRSRQRGIGTGIIWQTDGGVLTNHHVADHAGASLEVMLADGRKFEAKVIASDPILDVALMKIEAKDLPVATIGDSTALRIGELVFALGHPWGQHEALTAGIVSGLGTLTINGTGHEAPYIRSDVRLAPGNSGGPMLNARGEVVGINAMIFGGDLSVAIPSNVAQTWINALPDKPVKTEKKAPPAEKSFEIMGYRG